MTSKLVLFFTDGVSLQTWESVGNLERELAIYKRMADHGKNVEFITYGNASELSFKKSISPIQIRCNRFGLPIDMYKSTLVRFPARGDVFKSNQLLGSEVALKAARTARAKFIARCGYLISVFEANQHGSNSLQAVESRQLEEKIFRGADKIVVTTVSMAESVRNGYGIPEDKIRVIPNYVETELFKPQPKEKRLIPRLVSVGRFEEQKNYRVLIEAIAPMNVEMIFVGDGSQRIDLEDAARGSTANIKFVGNIPNSQIADLLTTCDLFILPSKYEGHPKALLEAMSCGLPVVGTKVPGIIEVIVDGKNGVLSDPNVQAIREAIHRLLADSDLRTRLGEAARKLVERNFSLDHVFNLEISLIDDLMLQTNAKR